MLAAKWAELWDELQCSFAEAHSNARELWEPDAQMVAVRHDDVAQSLEVVAEGGQLGNEARRSGR